MIPVSIPFFFFILLFLALVVLFTCWLYYAFKQRATEERRTHNRIYRCASCGHVYLDALDLPMASCPRCAHMNESIRR